jgi:hypothetical protein
MEVPPMKPKSLQAHIAASYTMLRIGMAVLAIVLPFLLWIAGHILAGLPLQGSMSAYYHAGGGAVRDVFVGALFAIGVFLMLYKGFTDFENWALNLAGGFLLIVAVVPMAWGCGNACPKFSWHGTASVVFFLSIAYVCIFRSADTLGLMLDQERATFYRRAYKLMGGAMIASPAIAFALKLFLQPDPGKGSFIFYIEAVGVVVFGSYWLLKSFEIRETHAERQAVEGHLKIAAYSIADFFKPISVKRVDHTKGPDPDR